MDITDLAWNERSKRRLSGACSLGGHALSITLERPAGEVAGALELRHASGSLPPSLLALSVVILAGTTCAVQALRADGQQVLQGQMPAADAERQFLPPTPTPLPPADPGAPPPAKQHGEADSPESLLERFRAAKARIAAADPAAMRERVAAVERELEAARKLLAESEAGLAAARSEAADLGARLREAVEREVS